MCKIICRLSAFLQSFATRRSKSSRKSKRKRKSLQSTRMMSKRPVPMAMTAKLTRQPRVTTYWKILKEQTKRQAQMSKIRQKPKRIVTLMRLLLLSILILILWETTSLHRKRAKKQQSRHLRTIKLEIIMSHRWLILILRKRLQLQIIRL